MTTQRIRGAAQALLDAQDAERAAVSDYNRMAVGWRDSTKLNAAAEQSRRAQNDLVAALAEPEASDAACPVVPFHVLAQMMWRSDPAPMVLQSDHLAAVAALQERIDILEADLAHSHAATLEAEADSGREAGERAAAEARALAAEAKLNAPELRDFVAGVVLEAAHQRDRWGSEHDAGKDPQDWFWLLGYLAGKALKAHACGDTDKALHHTISSAAALANWHAAILGSDTSMRPGIDPVARGITTEGTA